MSQRTYIRQTVREAPSALRVCESAFQRLRANIVRRDGYACTFNLSMGDGRECVAPCPELTLRVAPQCLGVGVRCPNSQDHTRQRCVAGKDRSGQWLVRDPRSAAHARICYLARAASSWPCPGGGIGRRVGLKIRWPSGLVGSSPTPGTKSLSHAKVCFQGLKAALASLAGKCR